MAQRIPDPNVLVGNIYIARGRNGKIWLIANESLGGEYRGEGLEPDDAAMEEMSEWLEKFFLKHISEAVWPAGHTK